MCDQEDQGANVPDDELLVEEPTCEYTLTLKTTYGCPAAWFVCAIKKILPLKKKKKKRFACELRVRVCPLVASGDPFLCRDTKASMCIPRGFGVYTSLYAVVCLMHFLKEKKIF